MNNTILSYRNWVLDPGVVVSASISGSGSEAGASNLLKPQLSKAAVWTGNPPDGGAVVECRAQFTLTPDNAAGRTVRVVGILAAHLRQYDGLFNEDAERAVTNAEWRIVGKNWGGAEVFTTGWKSLLWFPDAGVETNVWHIFDEDQESVYTIDAYMRIDLNTFPNPVKVSMGSVWAGPGFGTEDGLIEGWSTQIVDPGVMAKSKGRQGYQSRLRRTRRLSASWAPVSFDVAYGNPATPTVADMQSVMGEIGSAGYCVMFARTRDSAGASSDHIQRRLGIYGHFTEIGTLVDKGGNMFGWEQFAVEELL